MNWNSRYAKSMTKEEWLERYHGQWNPNKVPCPPGQSCGTKDIPCSECYFKSRAKSRYYSRFKRFVREEVVKRFPHLEPEPYEASTRVDVDNEVEKTRADAIAFVDKRLNEGTNPELLYESEPEDVEGRGWREGQLITRVRNITKRNKTARKDKIANVRANNQGHLICEGCGQDMHRDDRVEIHHENPLQYIQSTYQLDPIKDLACYCANCHGFVTRVEQSTRTSGQSGVNLTRNQMRSLNNMYKNNNVKKVIEPYIHNINIGRIDANTINFFQNL